MTARSLAPGSALGCLDAVASAVVENACERPLFASPEAVAAAVGYVDARFSLLAASAALAERDPSYQPAFERLRRGLEADRYGLVAHVLTTRGCNGADCAELRLLRDPARVVANMKARAFEASLGAHALAWQPNGRQRRRWHRRRRRRSHCRHGASTPARGTGGTVAPARLGAAGSAKFDFPSASSIPAVSIMNAEPGPPPAAEPRPSTPPPKRRGRAPSPPPDARARRAAASRRHRRTPPAAAAAPAADRAGACASRAGAPTGQTDLHSTR